LHRWWHPGRARPVRLTVTVTIDGEPQPLAAGTDLAAYRIVQEALTNVTKHAATSQAQVRLAYDDSQLGLTITNDSVGLQPAPTAVSSGYGLIGMSEQAQSVGGRLHAGHRPAGGRSHRRAATGSAPARRPLPMTIRVLLADDQALLRQTFKILIDATPT
jgi:signal transduction histidine kinase